MYPELLECHCSFCHKLLDSAASFWTAGCTCDKYKKAVEEIVRQRQRLTEMAAREYEAKKPVQVFRSSKTVRTKDAAHELVLEVSKHKSGDKTLSVLIPLAGEDAVNAEIPSLCWEFGEADAKALLTLLQEYFLQITEVLFTNKVGEANDC